ncbi:hypothetical protein GCM10017788_41280 [Amycolatopsis acidiphila]|nr:hypothetical protein GCM10017788_41280 [Amycolatopsis acidiphila]
MTCPSRTPSSSAILCSIDCTALGKLPVTFLIHSLVESPACIVPAHKTTRPDRVAQNEATVQ